MALSLNSEITRRVTGAYDNLNLHPGAVEKSSHGCTPVPFPKDPSASLFLKGELRSSFNVDFGTESTDRLAPENMLLPTYIRLTDALLECWAAGTEDPNLQDKNCPLHSPVSFRLIEGAQLFRCAHAANDAQREEVRAFAA